MRRIDIVQDAAMERIACTPGVIPISAPKLVTLAGGHELHVDAWIWTAAMERLAVRWVVKVPAQTAVRPRRPLARRIDDALASRLALQRQRHRLATAHGLGDYDDERLSAGHFAIDASAARLLAGHGASLATAIHWHRLNATDDGASRTVTARGTSNVAITQIAIGTDPDDGDAVLFAETQIGRPGGPAAALYNRTVLVDARIPETALTAAIGRRLGDVVETGVDHLDERVIEDARLHRDRQSRFTLARDRITVAAAMQLQDRERIR